jgi:hypothetical protein
VTFFLWTALLVVALATVVDVVELLELLELPQPAIPTAAAITASNVRLIALPLP